MFDDLPTRRTNPDARHHARQSCGVNHPVDLPEALEIARQPQVTVYKFDAPSSQCKAVSFGSGTRQVVDALQLEAVAGPARTQPLCKGATDEAADSCDEYSHTAPVTSQVSPAAARR